MEPTDEQYDILISIFTDVEDMQDALILFQTLVNSLTSKQLTQLCNNVDLTQGDS